MGGIANATWEELEFYRLRDNIGRVVNPLNGDIYVFGGNTIPGLGVEGAFNDLWCFNRSSNGWTRLSGGDPDIMGRGEAALAFDAATGTIYMSGGRKGEMPYELRDLWAFDLEGLTWTSLESDVGVRLIEMGVMGGNIYGVGPDYSPMRMVVYNISTGQVDIFNIISQQTPLLLGTGVTFDQSSGKFYFFGGFDYFNSDWYAVQDLRALNVRTRLLQELAPFPASGRGLVDLAYAPDVRGLYMYGGTEERINANDYDHDDLWLYGIANDTWTLLMDDADAGEFQDHRLMYDPVGKVLYIHWMYVYAKYNAFWALSLGDMQWHEKPPPTSPLPFIFGSVVALGDRIVMAGGKEPTSSTTRGERWDYSIATGEWVDMSSDSDLRGLYLMTTTRDATGDRAFAFGGFWGLGRSYYNLYSKSGGGEFWRRLGPVNDPPTLSNGTMAYSEQDESLYLYGGRNMTSGELSADLWRYDLGDARWELVVTGGPPAREHSAMVYDRDGVLVLFAGWDGSAALKDLWTFNISTVAWTRATEQGTWPVPRYQLAADCIPTFHRMMVFGGSTGSGARLGDMWSYSVRTGNWTPVVTTNTPPARFGHSLTMNPSTGELYLIGGLESDNSLWRLRVMTDPLAITPRPGDVNVREDEPFWIEFTTSNWTTVKWAVTKEASWLVWNETDRSLRGVPRNGDVGSTWVTVRASVDQDIYDEVRFRVTVENVPPRILPFEPGVAKEDETYRLDLGSDDDGQGHVSWYLGPKSPAWLNIDPDTGTMDGIPNNDDVGLINVTVTVDDGNGGLTTVAFELEVLNSNDPPTITTSDVTQVSQCEMYSVDYDAVDIDPTHDELVWSLDTQAVFLAIDARTGVLSGSPGVNCAGKFLVRVRVTDGNGGQDEHLFTLTVLEAPPRIVSIDGEPIEVAVTVEVPEGGERILAVEVWDEDPPTLQYRVTSDLGGVSIDGNGSVRLAPVQGDAGEHFVTVVVTDRWGGSDEAMFKVVVQDVNEAPRFSPVPPLLLTIDEDREFTLKLNATDIEGDPISWADDTDLFDIDTHSGEIKFTPTQRDVGKHDVTITISDGRGGESSYVITITVRNVNDPPVIERLEPASGTSHREGDIVRFRATASDEDGDALTYTWMEGGSVLGVGAELEYAGLAVGTHTVTLVVGDGNISTSQDVLVTITPVTPTAPGHGLVWVLLVVAVVAIIGISVLYWLHRRP